MDALKLHLLTNYYPALGMIVGTLLLIVGFVRGSDRIKRWSLKIFIVMAVFVFLVFEAGEIAGSVEGTYAGAFAESLQQHRMSARMAFIGMEAAGLMSLLALFLLKRESKRASLINIAVLALSIITCGLILQTTYFGRQVKWAGAAPESSKPANVKKQPGL